MEILALFVGLVIGGLWLLNGRIGDSANPRGCLILGALLVLALLVLGSAFVPSGNPR